MSSLSASDEAEPVAAPVAAAVAVSAAEAESETVPAANEALCPVCKIVIRSTRELRPGDRLYCMACMTRLTVVRAEGGGLEAQVVYSQSAVRPGEPIARNRSSARR